MQNQPYQQEPPQQPEPRKNKLSTPIIIVIAVVGVCGLCGLMGTIGAIFQKKGPVDLSQANSNTKTADTPQKETLKSSTPEPKKESAGVNLENFNKIKTGMSYEKVVEILGEEGTLMSENEIGGYRTVMYQWKGGVMANMSCMFQNGKLISKSQFGL